ncbi:CLUMA_CG003063, isoform A [Clunio marinus]|uniref:CLUMA_CG003063, isoform A n=1 Tax=Clunio marinus TaxID=568069 RepID=A0A1J1HML2_9DIPT|nr:CLUMA_CG003063, isoform A [Clunio marinus]
MKALEAENTSHGAISSYFYCFRIDAIHLHNKIGNTYLCAAVRLKARTKKSLWNGNVIEVKNVDVFNVFLTLKNNSGLGIGFSTRIVKGLKVSTRVSVTSKPLVCHFRYPKLRIHGMK